MYLDKAFCRNNEQTTAGEQAQRLGSQLNRNAMICDLHLFAKG